LAAARGFAEAFFAHYNHEHRHSGIGYHTPASVHDGTAAGVRACGSCQPEWGAGKPRLASSSLAVVGVTGVGSRWVDPRGTR
jgi:hypothetical protein